MPSQDRFAGSIGKADILEHDIADDGRQRNRARGVGFLGRLQKQLARSLEARNRLTELGPDACYLRQRHDEEAEKQDVGEQPADGQEHRLRSAMRRSA